MNPPRGGFLFVWKTSSRLFRLSKPLLHAISARRREGRLREQSSLSDQAALGKENAPMSVRDFAVRRELDSESIVELVAGLAAVVLGILGSSGFAPTRFALIALLELGCVSRLTSPAIAGTFVRAFPNRFTRMGLRERQIRSGRPPDSSLRSFRRDAGGIADDHCRQLW